MSQLELLAADTRATGITPDQHPIALLRERLDALGATPTGRLAGIADGTRIRVGGAVTHRQRPEAAGGITFLNLEDETGMANIICSAGLWARHRQVVRNSPALLIRGLAQTAHGSTSIQADHIDPLEIGVPTASRDYR